MCHLGFNHFEQKNLNHSFSLNLIMSAILNSIILDSAILHKINFTHSFWLNLMMAAILNSARLDSATAILDSVTLLSSLRFTQWHSYCTLTLTQTNSIWLKLIHAYLTWWWQPSWILSSWILPSLIQPFCTKLWLKLIHSHSTWRCQPSWILPLGFSHFEQKKFTHSFSLNLRMVAIFNSTILDSAILHKEKLHSFILTLLDGHSHLEFCQVGFSHCHLGFRHLVIFSQIHLETLSLHSDSDSN